MSLIHRSSQNLVHLSYWRRIQKKIWKRRNPARGQVGWRKEEDRTSSEMTHLHLRLMTCRSLSSKRKHSKISLTTKNSQRRRNLKTQTMHHEQCRRSQGGRLRIAMKISRLSQLGRRNKYWSLTVRKINKLRRRSMRRWRKNQSHLTFDWSAGMNSKKKSWWINSREERMDSSTRSTLIPWERNRLSVWGATTS